MFEACDRLVREFEAVIKRPVKEPSAVYYTGVDLGTACVVLAVLDEHFRPVAGAFRYADVVRDGMVVDYIGAIRIVRELADVIVTPGTEFGPQYVHQFRINFSQDKEKAAAAMKRLFAVMERYRKQ